MRPLLKAAGVALAALALLLAGGGLLLRRLLPPERLRQLVVERAQRSLGREVRLGGASLGLISGLRLTDLAISEKPSFSAGTFASMRAFSARVRWAPLLRRELVVDSLSAEGLSMSVVGAPDGSYNFSDMLSASTAAPAEVSGPLRLAVRSLRLRDSRLSYREAGRDRDVRVSDIDAEVGGFSLTGLFDARLSAVASGRWGGRETAGRVSFSGRLDLGGSDPRAFRAEIKALELSARGWNTRVSGRAAGLEKPALDVRLALARDGRRLLRGSFKGDVSPPSGARGAAVSGDVSLSASALAAEDAASLGLPAGWRLPAFEGSAGLAYSGAALRIKALSLSGVFGRLEGEGSVVGLSSGKPRADVDLSAALRLPALRAQDLPWAVLSPRFRSPPLELEGRGRLKGDELSLTRLKVSGRAGAVEASGVVRALFSGAPRPDLALTLDLSLPALVSADVPWPGVPGGLELPASRWNGSLSVAPDAVKVPSLRVVVGRNDVEIAGGGVSGWKENATRVAGLVKCRRFQLEELTSVTPRTRGMGLTGSGFFALAVSGRPSRPVLQGKLQFKDLGAIVGGLPFSGFTGTAAFSEKRIDIPNLKGRIGDGDLAMDLTVKDYLRAPDVDLEASLTRFDLGRWLAAKTALSGSTPPAKTPPAAPPSVPPVSARGRLTVEELVHPNAQARNVRAEWNLSGIGPDLRRLNGTAEFSSSSGHFSDLRSLVAQSAIVKVVLSVLSVTQTIGRLGGGKVLNLNDVRYSLLQGDYAFKDGLMSLRENRLDGDTAQVEATGDIDLPAERLNLTVTARTPTALPTVIDVSGTFDDPKPRYRFAKSIAEPATRVIRGLIPH